MQEAVRVKVLVALSKVSKEKRHLERRAAELQQAEDQFGSGQPGRKTMPAADTAALALRARRMNQALENAADPSPEPYRTLAKNMKAAAGALVHVRFSDGHPDKEIFEQGLEHLKTVVVTQDNYALSKSHVGTLGDMVSTASWRSHKSATRHQEHCRPNAHGATPLPLYEPRNNHTQP